MDELRLTRCSRCSFSGRVVAWTLGLLAAFVPTLLSAAEPEPFRITEATIPDLQKAMEDGTVTSERLVRYYLNRIRAYDDVSPTGGPAINSVLAINPHAIDTARALDEERRVSGPRGPLHGIPILLKDVYDTFDIPTTAGCLALEGSIPPDDAFVVRKLREAGAVILGKNNVDDFCYSCTFSGGLSSLGGQTKNPYDLTRSPGYSSGGVGAAIGANLAAVGLGTDAGGSIRIPAAYQSLVGIKVALGITSRDGVINLTRRQDVTGPMTRSVVDTAIVLDAIAGPDPADPATAASEGHVPASYLDFLDSAGLQGARIGILEYNYSSKNPAVTAVFNAAVAELQAAGAEVVTSIDGAAFNDILDAHFWDLFLFLFASPHYDLNNHLRSLGPDAPMHSIEEVHASGRYLSCLNDTLFANMWEDRPPAEHPDYPKIAALEDELREALLEALVANDLDALVYPTNPENPAHIGSSDGGLPNTWPVNWAKILPAITVPAGFTPDGLPVGIEFLGPPFREGEIIRLAYAYEQATHHRRPPASAPPLDCDKDGVPDEEEIAAGSATDIDIDGVPDDCEPDCNSSGLPDDFDVSSGTSKDCNGNGVPDECDIASGRDYDCDGSGLLDECELSPFPARLAGNTTGIAESTFLGPPDAVHAGIGGESVTCDFGPGKVADGPGADFSVYEGSSGAMEFSSIDVLVSEDGKSFTSVKGTQSSFVRVRGDDAFKLIGLGRSYDLGPSGLVAARYVRIQGLVAEPAGEGRGFDLDAVGAVHFQVCPLPDFIRGDPNDDGKIDISDGVFVLNWLFLGSSTPGCAASAEVNGDGLADISDAVYVLGFLFLGGPAPAGPFPDCGPGTLPSDDVLGCATAPRKCVKL